MPVVDPDEDGIVAVEPIGLDVDRWLPHAVRDTRYCWCDCLSLAACTYGFIHRFYVIELHFNPWNKDDPRNAKLIRKDTIGDQRPIFANEHGKVYIRRNGYTTPVNEKDIGSLKKTCFQKGQGLPQGVQEEGTDYYSYEEL